MTWGEVIHIAQTSRQPSESPTIRSASYHDAGTRPSPGKAPLGSQVCLLRRRTELWVSALADRALSATAALVMGGGASNPDEFDMSGFLEHAQNYEPRYEILDVVDML